MFINDHSGGQVDEQRQTKGQPLFEDMFKAEWNSKRHTQSKLSFYNEIKPEFGYEPYLNIKISSRRKNLSRFRLSAHDLNIEQGRYNKKGTVSTITDRTCRFCCLKDDRIHLELFEVLLPDFNPIIETEQHVLTECPGYHRLRINLSDVLKSQLMLCNYMDIFCNPILADELGSYLNQCFLLRNPDGKTRTSTKSKNEKKKKKNLHKK